MAIILHRRRSVYIILYTLNFVLIIIPSFRMVQAAEKIGFPEIRDMHSPLEPSIGWSKQQFAVDAVGKRQSAFRAYLPVEFIKSRSDNLHICTSAFAQKITFVHKDAGELRADAVEVRSIDGRSIRVVSAKREIILTAGALRTPQLLMLRCVLLVRLVLIDNHNTLSVASVHKSIFKKWVLSLSNTLLASGSTLYVVLPDHCLSSFKCRLLTSPVNSKTI